MSNTTDPRGLNIDCFYRGTNAMPDGVELFMNLEESTGECMSIAVHSRGEFVGAAFFNGAQWIAFRMGGDKPTPTGGNFIAAVEALVF